MYYLPDFVGGTRVAEISSIISPETSVIGTHISLEGSLSSAEVSVSEVISKRNAPRGVFGCGWKQVIN